jgi:hypothetical protein
MPLTDIITPTWVKERFLVGVNLVTDDGLPYPDELYEIAIENAIEAIQDELDVVLDATTITGEKHDTFNNVNGFPNFAPIRLRKRPVRAVTAMEAKWGQNDVVNIPTSWLNLDNSTGDKSFTGSLTIIPTQESLAASSYGLVWQQWRDVAPLWWRVSYTAGWATAAEVPASFLMVIGWTAALLPLDTAGDLIAGAGIASKSVSIDGLSTSISTTSSATNAGYGARILSYQKQIATVMAGLRRKYEIREFCAI